MKATIQVINRMRTDGVIGNYAIGGAVGATFYAEPAETKDIDVFVAFHLSPGSLLVTLTPIYEYLAKLGYSEFKDEGIVVESWPVQFLPASDALDTEALDQAADTELDDVPVRVMQPEHLVAIALRTGRGKDYLRIIALVNSGRVNADKLDGILKRFKLLEKWVIFEDKYMRDEGLK